MRYALSSLCLATLLCTGAQALAQQPIKIATDATFPPFEYIDAQGQLAGYDVELAQAVCEAAELDCELIAAAWDGMIPGLMSRKYDALISQLTVTEERRRSMAFTEVYSRPVFRFVGRDGSEYDFVEGDLAGATIAVQTGTPMDAFVSRHFPRSTIKRYDSSSAAYLELVSGRADLVMSYEAQITYGFLSDRGREGFTLMGPRYTGQDAPEFGEGVAIAVNKRNDALREKLDQGLAKLRETGAIEALDAKYLGGE
ncbi:transporter substrate-binding domain-containing protein [Halotalea alkalilenta]|uniref:transporter substrate-binding domain-containing protein n=1 Tax=Halotalea alkalilenta TaxID=376489 RepID=UPI0005B95B53|nr:transporter substrate-binding domain-containing protein [Halotalea alkalilenta]